jgi:hypothetical protein
LGIHVPSSLNQISYPGGANGLKAQVGGQVIALLRPAPQSAELIGAPRAGHGRWPLGIFTDEKKLLEAQTQVALTYTLVAIPIAENAEHPRLANRT